MLWKRLLHNGIFGMLTGIALSNIIALIVSYALHLGYFMPYPAALPEVVGGELNATMLVMAFCGLLGAGIGLALGFISRQQSHP